jgi:hypothetical protein
MAARALSPVEEVMPSPLVRAVPFALTLPLLAVVAGASAEERCKFSYDASASQTKNPQRLMMDVGDIPGHKVGSYEQRRTYSVPKPICEGRKIVEQWSHGFRDLIDRNGRSWGYLVLTLDYGDKIYGQFSGTVQTVVAADGWAKTS